VLQLVATLVTVINIRRFYLLLCTLISLVIFSAGLVNTALATNLLQKQIKELLASDSSPRDIYGIIVALSVDTAVIGVPFDNTKSFNSGSAYIYTRNNGAWALQQQLLASDSAPGDQYGWSVALQGDTVLIGARFDDDKGFNSGSAYVYTRNAGVWTEQQKLTANDGAVNDQYGITISLAGDTVAIGAPFDDDNGFDSGSAYVYSLNAGVWILQQKLTTSDGAPGDQYGWSVALEGDSALIGARFDDDKGFNSGSAYLYNLDAGAWVMKQKLIAADGAVNDQFGWSVALDDDTAVIGARFDDDTGINSGSAYVYTRSDGEWGLQQNLTASDGAPGNQYSWAVALDGDTVIIGAPFDNDQDRLSGSCYVYTRNADVWSEKQKLTASIEVLGERYGMSVALEGNTMVVGSCLDYQRGSLSGFTYINTTCVPLLHETTNLSGSD